uniref:Glucosylceramidase n=1 Tax=Tetranychus urticae TaxID=32264 RepID=T1KFI1_TETUR
MKIMNPSCKYFIHITIIVILLTSSSEQACDRPFEGFGVHLGQLGSFNKTSYNNQQSVLDHLYADLGLRLFRTEYLSKFSPAEDVYTIDCIDEQTCAWIRMHSLISNYPDVSLFASVWSPPLYMKDRFHQLKSSYEWKYYNYLKNITQQIKHTFGLNIGPISLINEPENVFAPWEHTVMGPRQLCRLIDMYKDELLSVCPENSYFWITKLYLNYRDISTNCYSSCSIISTHGYYVNTNLLSSNRFQVYYDTGQNKHSYDKPIWMTEICSTLPGTKNSIQEAIDLGVSIVNFIGHTCVTRYYYWLAFTLFPSGESLIWLTPKTNATGIQQTLFFPKKYFAYRHFTRASFPGNRRVRQCSTDSFYCLTFDNNYVFVNNQQDKAIKLKYEVPLCCTTRENDWICGRYVGLIPPKSICSVDLNS